jgi:hypothetical protein
LPSRFAFDAELLIKVSATLRLPLDECWTTMSTTGSRHRIEPVLRTDYAVVGVIL